MPGYFANLAAGQPDRTAEMQAMIDASIYGGTANQSGGHHARVKFPPGIWRYTKTLHGGYGVGGFSSVWLEGEGNAYAGNPGFGGTIFLADFDDGPAINFQGSRSPKMTDITLLGRNYDHIHDNDLGGANPLLDDTIAENWLDPAIPRRALGRYTPYAGVSVDAYSGPRPIESLPDVDYPAFLGNPGQYNKAFSSDLTLIDVRILGFVATVAVQPCDADGNGDFVKTVRARFSHSIWGVGAGNTQSRNLSSENLTLNRMFCGMTAKQFGRGNGKFHGPINNISASNIIKLVDVDSTSVAGPLIFTGGYAENLHKIGDFGLGSSAETAVIFKALTLDFGGQNDARGVPAQTFGGDNRPVGIRFTGCTLNAIPSVAVFGTKNVVLEDTQIISNRMKPGAIVEMYEKFAHNVLAGGVFAGDGQPRPGQSIKFSPYNLDTGALMDPIMSEDGTRESSRVTCIPHHIFQVNHKFDPYDGPVRKKVRPTVIPKANTVAAISGRELIMTIPPRSEGRFARLGPLPGYVMIDDESGTVVFVKTRNGLTITGVIQNNYKNGQIWKPISLNTGHWIVLNSCLYVTPYYARADLVQGSNALTNVASDDGDGAWLPDAVKVGDYPYIIDTHDSWVNPEGCRVVAVHPQTATAPASIVLGSAARRPATKQRLEVFIRSPA